MAPGDLGSYKLVNMNLANYIKKKAVKFILSWVVSVLSSTMCFLVILCDWVFFYILYDFIKWFRSAVCFSKAA